MLFKPASMVFRRYEFRLSTATYLLCSGAETRHVEGAVLPGRLALLVLRDVFRADAEGVRSAFAELSGATDLRQAGEAEILSWFGAALGEAYLRPGLAWLAIVEVGARAYDTEDALRLAGSAAGKILRRLSDERLIELFHRGNVYRVVPGRPKRAVVSRALAAEDRLEPHAAEAVLREMAADPFRSPTARATLTDVTPFVGPSVGVVPEQRLELVRVPRRFQAPPQRAPAPAPKTPSQLHEKTKAISAEEVDWVEIRLIDDSGKPIGSQAYSVRLADGSTREGVLDADGSAFLGGIKPGSCEVTFPGFTAHVAA